MSNVLNFEVTANRLELKDGFRPVNTEYNYTQIRVKFAEGYGWENCTLITAGYFVSANQILSVVPSASAELTFTFAIPAEMRGSGVSEFHFGVIGSYTENGQTVTVATNIVTVSAARGLLLGEVVDLSAYEKLLAALNAGLALKENLSNKVDRIDSEISLSSTQLYPSINAMIHYLLSHYYDKDDVDGAVESLESDVLSWLGNYYTKAQMDSKWWDKVVIPDTDSEYFPGRFVTPEMYGAKADGVTDDSEAIQLAINGGNRKVVLMVGNYATDSTIVIEGQRDVIQVGTITYRGNGSAVKIQKVTTHCNLKFDKILAESGNGIEFYASSYSTNNKQYVQYVKLEFDIIKANDKCIYLNLDVESGLDSADIGWINEIIISNGHFAKGNYGIYGDAKGYSRMNNIKLYNVSIEGIKNNAGTAVGIFMANGCKRWSFVNMRYADNEFDYLMTTVGVVKEFLFYGPQWARDSLWDLSNETNGIINIPVHGEFSAGTISGMTRIVNGGEIGHTPNYEIDGLNTIVTGLRSVTDRFTFNSTGNYDNDDRKTLIQHGIVPAVAGWYFVSLNTNANGNSGKTASVYIVRVFNHYSNGIIINNVIPIYLGEDDLAPRVAADGELSKKDANSTDTNKFVSVAIKIY